MWQASAFLLDVPTMFPASLIMFAFGTIPSDAENAHAWRETLPQTRRSSHCSHSRLADGLICVVFVCVFLWFVLLWFGLPCVSALYSVFTCPVRTSSHPFHLFHSLQRVLLGCGVSWVFVGCLLCFFWFGLCLLACFRLFVSCFPLLLCMP